MSRARNLKPGIFTNEILGTADPLLTLLFEGLWCLADKEGRLEDRPAKIRAEIFPFRPGIELDAMLNDLQRFGFIKRYEFENNALIQVIKFKKHQRPHHTEKDSVYPGPHDDKSLFDKDINEEKTTLTVKSALDNGELTVLERSDLLIPDSGFLIPDSGYLNPDKKSKSANLAAKAASDDASLKAFSIFWDLYPKRPGANKTQAWRQWQARVRAGSTFDEMQRGADRYRRYCKAMQVEERFIKQAATFLGPDEHFRLDWKPSRKGSFADRLTGRDRADDDGPIIDV